MIKGTIYAIIKFCKASLNSNNTIIFKNQGSEAFKLTILDYVCFAVGKASRKWGRKRPSADGSITFP